LLQPGIETARGRCYLRLTPELYALSDAPHDSEEQARSRFVLLHGLVRADLLLPVAKHSLLERTWEQVYAAFRGYLSLHQALGTSGGPSWGFVAIQLSRAGMLGAVSLPQQRHYMALCKGLGCGYPPA